MGRERGNPRAGFGLWTRGVVPALPAGKGGDGNSVAAGGTVESGVKSVGNIPCVRSMFGRSWWDLQNQERTLAVHVLIRTRPRNPRG